MFGGTRVVTGLVLSIGLLAAGCKVKKESGVKNFKSELFGDNVYVFSPEDDVAQVQKILDEIYEKQESAQFGTERFAVYFMPGEYDPSLKVSMGFYTQVAGLGSKPTDTKIPFFQNLARWITTNPKNHNACCNFWRGIENIEIMSDTVWAVSQATSMRRVKIDGNVFYHDDMGWCSGGFMADSVVSKNADSGSQQQWLSRNNRMKSWTGAAWNMVFMGDQREVPLDKKWPEKPWTELSETPVIREKPFLVFDQKNGWGVFVPDWRRNCSGISWENESQDGKFIPIDKFFVAKPENTAAQINQALENGKHILFTPGIYRLDGTIHVSKHDTVVLGMGLATLESTAGKNILETEDVDGLVIAGLLFEAGQEKVDTMVTVGKSGVHKSHRDNPILLADLYFRIGGTVTDRPTQAETCIVVNSDDTVGDNFWIWRADHGTQVGWDLNTAETGIVVNGDNVKMYGLMVEHFRKHETVWNGNNGQIVMYQCEIPYDVPGQDVWMSHEGKVKGYASISVNPSVTKFWGTGIGIYLLNRKAAVTLESAVELPDAEGVRIDNICGVIIGGNPGMSHIVNDAGESLEKPFARKILNWYENGRWE